MRQIPGLRWLFAGMVIFGLTGWAVTGLIIYGRMAYLGLMMIAGAGLWSLLSMRGIHLLRHARSLRASMGQVFEEHFEIRNDTWPPCLWLEVINQSSLPMAGGSRLITGIGTRQRRFYTARTLLYRRGAFLLGPTSLSSGDPFGLFTVHKQVFATDTLVVLPMAVPINNFPPPPGILPGGKAVRQRTVHRLPHRPRTVPAEPDDLLQPPTQLHPAARADRPLRERLVHSLSRPDVLRGLSRGPDAAHASGVDPAGSTGPQLDPLGRLPLEAHRGGAREPGRLPEVPHDLLLHRLPPEAAAHFELGQPAQPSPGQLAHARRPELPRHGGPERHRELRRLS